MRRTLSGGIVGAISVLLALAACTGAAPIPTAPASPTQTAPTVEVSPTSTGGTEASEPETSAESLPTPGGPVWPLTGVATNEIDQVPAIAVKIENDWTAHPLTGLESADNIWEETVEGTITRFVAVFHSKRPEWVEPIRSTRPMDAGIVAPLGGILAFSGGQPGFVAEVEAAGVQVLSEDRGNRGFRRDTTRLAPHNVQGFLQDFLDQAANDRLAPPPEQFRFATPGNSTAELDGTAAEHITAVFGPLQTTNWDWDAATNTWLRSEFQSESVSSTGDRHAATNIVLLHMNQVDTGTVDPSGTPVFETLMVDSGTGTVASGGKAIDVRWSKSATDAPLVLTTMSGDPVLLEPGQTWIELIVAVNGDWTIE
jgi:hypothetical protein